MQCATTQQLRGDQREIFRVWDGQAEYDTDVEIQRRDNREKMKSAASPLLGALVKKTGTRSI